MPKFFAAGGAVHRVRSWFPDREFFMRSQGQVRFVTITSRVQMTLAGALLALVLLWAASVIGMAWASFSSQSDMAALAAREARVATAEERHQAYGQDIDAVADDLARRQAFIEDMVDSLPADLRDGAAESAAASGSRTQAARTVDKVSAAFPEAAALVRIEARQLAFVERLTRLADSRAARAEQAIERLGLDPRAMLRGAERAAMGGPFEALATASDGTIDPRFEKLGLSLARMAALERGLEGIPQVLPASANSISSGFGVRSDPFTGTGAMHKGLDFAGPMGAPIHSAAKGRVSFVGTNGGYGNVVEITHGNGMMTRYAHMSRFSTRVGEEVEAGEVIGAIGSTGRSTGPHLHFEVWINNRAVNPRPFLEAAPDVLEEARRRPERARR